MLCKGCRSLVYSFSLTCPRCTGWSTPSWWSETSLCSHVGPDSQGRAAVAGQPVCPALGSEQSWCAGTRKWWRLTLLLKARGEKEEMKKTSHHYCTVFLSKWNSVYLYTWLAAITRIIHDVKEFMFRESACIFAVLKHIVHPTARCLPHFTCKETNVRKRNEYAVYLFDTNTG